MIQLSYDLVGATRTVVAPTESYDLDPMTVLVAPTWNHTTLIQLSRSWLHQRKSYDLDPTVSRSYDLVATMTVGKVVYDLDLVGATNSVMVAPTKSYDLDPTVKVVIQLQPTKSYDLDPTVLVAPTESYDLDPTVVVAFN